MPLTLDLELCLRGNSISFALLEFLDVKLYKEPKRVIKITCLEEGAATYGSRARLESGYTCDHFAVSVGDEDDPDKCYVIVLMTGKRQPEIELSGNDASGYHCRTIWTICPLSEYLGELSKLYDNCTSMVYETVPDYPDCMH